MRRNRTRNGLWAMVLALAVVASCSSHPTTTATTATTAPTPAPTPTAGSIPTASSSAVATKPAATTAARSKSSAATAGLARKPVPKPRLPVVPRRPTFNTLTGGGLTANPVVAVKIDNTYFEVAQFGVSEADIVFVEQVEGGLTRLIAIFHSNLPSEVGPVRSVRSTDAELLPVFGRPALVFSGGAGGPLSDLSKSSVLDTSAFAGYFRSDAAAGTYNLHADLPAIVSQAQGLLPARPIGFTFAANDSRVGKGAAAFNISVVMEAGRTDFGYSDGHFVRMMDGSPVSDYQGRPEYADNVLVQHVIDEPDGTVDSIGSPSYLSHTVGAGAVTLYRDGHSIAGTWKRDAPGHPFVFADASHQPLPFKPGKTWVVLAPQTASVSVN